MKQPRGIPYLTFAAALLSFAPLARAGIAIEISGVEPQLEKNVRAFLSMTRYETRDDVSEEVMSRLQRRIPTEVRTALEPLGFYSATATYSAAQQSNAKHIVQWKVQIAIDPGRAVRLSEVIVQVHGPGAMDQTLQGIIAREDLHPGARLDHGVYESVKAELLRMAINQGYLDAKLIHNELLVDPNERRATVDLQLETGEQYRFGSIAIQQPVIKDWAARRLLRMQTGDAYSLDRLLETQYVFDDSQYFRGVEIEPGEPDRETHTVPLIIRADKNRRNRYAISGGYGTDTRLRGKLTWDNRFVNDNGHRLQVELLGSAISQEATTKYVIPVMDIALEKLEFSLSGKKEELGDSISRRAEFSAGLTQALGSWQRVLFVRLSRETNEVSADTPITEETSVPEKTFLIIPGISFATLPPSLLDRAPRRYSLYTELTGSPQTLGSDATFLQLRLQGERVFDLKPRWHLRLRGQAGITWSTDFDTLPVSHRFFAGGDNSVRGYGLNEISPTVGNARVGGRYLAVGSVEVERDLPKNFGVAVFADAGNAFDNLDDPFKYSTGIGGRYRLGGVASIGIDVAQSLSESGRSPHWHLRLTTLF